MHREVFEGRGDALLTVGEMPLVTVEEAMLFTDPARHELDMVFQFEHVDLDHGAGKWDRRPLQLVELKESLGRWQAGLAEVGWNSLYWNNHDQPRAVSRFGDDGEFRVESAKLLATVLHLHRGTPCVYQGEELGMTNVPFEDASSFRDIESVSYYHAAIEQGLPTEEVLEALRLGSRDNARSPMQWDASPHAGFTTGEPWFPVNPDFAEVNAAQALADPDSVFHHYRRLIELRHTDPVVAEGDFTMLLPEDPVVYAFTRSLDGTTVLVVANVSGAEHSVEGLPEAAQWARAELLLSSHARHSGPPASTEHALVLRPWEARVLRRTTR